MGHERRKELAEQFFFSVSKLIRGMRAIFRNEMERNDVTWPQFHVLSAVSENGEMTVTGISDYLVVSAPTASRMIDSLCTKGLLVKGKDPDDHRVARVALTDKSKKLLCELSDHRNQVIAGMFEGESDEELERTIGHLCEMSDRLLFRSDSGRREVQ